MASSIALAQSDRFVLIDQSSDVKSGEITATFVDQHTKEVIVKSYSLGSKDRLQAGSLKIPSQVPTLTGVDVTFKSAHPEGNVKSYVFPTQTISEMNHMRDKLKDRGLGRVKLASVTETLQGLKDLSLIQNQTNSKKGMATYFDHQTNEFVLVELPPNTSVPKRISSPSDLNINDIKVNRFDSKTPGQFNQATEDLQKKFQKDGFSFDAKKHNDHFKEVSDEFSQFRPFLEENKTEGNNRFQFKMSYSHDQRKLLIEKFKRKKSSLEFVEEEVFDLATETGHREALNYLKRYNLSEKEAVTDLVMSHADGCLWPTPAPAALALPGMASVMDKIYVDYLSRSLPQQLVSKGERSFQMEVTLLDGKVMLDIEVTPDGEIGDVSFNGKTPNGYRITKSENKQSHPGFIIEYKDGNNWKPLMGFVAENITKYQGGAVDLDMAVYVAGAKDGPTSYDAFEKSLFQLAVRPQKRIHTSARVSLAQKKSAEYPMGERPEDSGGLKNFFMQIFYGKNARRKEIKETVVKEVTKVLNDPDFRNLLSMREVEAGAERVTTKVGQRTNNFDASLTKLTAVAYEESMKEFVRAIMLKLMGQLLPEEKLEDLIKILEVTEKDFHACLRNASDNRNVKQAEECLAVFKVQAPIDMGIGALKAKLKNAGILGADHLAEKEYFRCVDQYYRPVMKREGANAEAQDLIKACVMGTAMHLLNLVLKDEVKRQASEVELKPGQKWQIPEAKLNELHRSAIQCFADKKLLKIGFPSIQIETRALMKVDAGMFTDALDECMGNTKVEVAEMAVREILSLKIKELAPMDAAKENEKIELVLKNSFNPCVKDMKDRKVPVDPTLCTSEVMIYATSLIVPEIGEKEIGAESYKEVMNSSAGKNALACFENKKAEFIKSRQSVMTKSDALKQKFMEEQEKKSELEIVGCLKGVVGLLASRAPEKLIEEHKQRLPDLAGISLNDEDKAFLRETISQCAQRELKQTASFDQLTKDLERLRNLCGVELLSTERAQRSIFLPVIKSSLSSMGLTPNETNELSEVVLKLASEEVKQSMTTDEIMERVQKLKGKAASKVIDFVLLSKIRSSLDGDPAQVEKKATEIRDRIKPLLLNDRDRLGERLEKVIESGNEAELNGLLDTLKLKALTLIAPEVIQDIGAKMIDDGLLSSKAQVDNLKLKAQQTIEECLKKAQGTADQKLESCMVDVQVDVMQSAVEMILNDQLNKESITKYVPKDKIAQIVKKISGENLRKKALEMAKAAPDKKKDLMLKLTRDLKVQTARELVPVLVPSLVNELLKVPNHYTVDQRTQFMLVRESTISDGNKLIDQCLKDFETQNAPDAMFDECLNRFRYKLVESFVPLKMRDILSLITSDEAVLKKIIDTQSSELRSCVRKVGFNQKMESFDSMIDHCIVTMIHNTTSSLVRDLSTDKELSLTDQNKLASFYQCIETNKTRFEKTQKINLSEGIDDVQQCLINRGIAPLFKGVVDKMFEVSGPNLSVRSKEALNALSGSLERIVTHRTKSGKELRMNIESVRSKTERPPRDEKWPGVVEFIKKFLPDAAKYINGAVKYDYPTLMRAISKFETDARDLIEKRDGDVDITEFNKVLAQSEMMDVLIKGFIADQIRAELHPFFVKYGLDLSLISYLSSKEMIDTLFSSKNPKGLQALNNLKQKWLLPVLNNQMEKVQLPEKEIADIKAVLANDTRMNGFAETILGAVIQKELDEKRAGIETGVKSIIAVPIAVFWHGVQRKDFYWGHRFDGGNKDNLRYQASGKKAISHFSTNILTPLMNKTLSDQQMDKEKKKVSEYVEKAMHENSWP